MTWKELKDETESKGVTDNMDIDYIDISNYEVSVKVDKENNSFSIS